MGKGQRTRERSARAKIAERRAQERRAEARRRILIAGGSVAVVLAVVIVLVVVKLSGVAAGSGSGAGSGAPVADSAVAGEIASVPQRTFDAVGMGSATGLRLRASGGGAELTLGGKPEVLYIGGEFCPYCAAERWAIAAAVSRFGTLDGVRFIHSSPAYVYASTPTLTFYGSSYQSQYLAFVPVEWYGEAVDTSTPFAHVYLQNPTDAEKAVFARYGGSALPFVDIGNRYLVPMLFSPGDLAGLTWAQVAAAMRDPSSTVGKDVDGAANMITAAICKLTGGQPGNVCRSAGVVVASRSI